MNELVLLSGDRDSAHNFQNLLFMTTSGTVKKAVEYKQQCASLNPCVVSNWVQTVVGITDFIQFISPNSLLDLLARDLGKAIRR